MSKTNAVVHFDLTDFPFAKAAIFILQFYRPAWVQRIYIVNWAFIFWSIALILSHFQYALTVSIPIAMFLIGLFGMTLLTYTLRKVSYKASSGSPLRSGLRSTWLDSSGIAYNSPFGQLLFPYTAFIDVVEWHGNVLFVISQYEHLPIPSAGFLTDDAKDSFIAEGKLRIAEAKGRKS